jgi:hypothetical protein
MAAMLNRTSLAIGLTGLLLAGSVQAEWMYTTNGCCEITITNYTGPGGAVTIPDKITNLPVTSIGNYAFLSKSTVSSVTISTNVTSIGFMAFFGSTSLTSVTIPNSVTHIEGGAFGYCTHLTDVTIPNSVATIGLKAFESCSSLLAITVDPLNSAYSSVDGVLVNKSQTTLIQFPGGQSREIHYP